MIKCKICSAEFKNIISWKHLKKHNITTKEYKEKYGELVSQEFRDLKSKQSSGNNNPNYGRKHTDEVKRKISKANKGNIPHNLSKGMSSEQKELLSKKAMERNKQWKETNSHPNTGRKHSEETIKKIRQKRKDQIITTDAVQKAIQTKKDRGYDLACFRGKRHTEKTKEKISLSSKKTALKKQQDKINELKNLLPNYNLELIERDSKYTSLRCTVCQGITTKSSQYLSKSKFKHDFCQHCYPPASTSNQEKEVREFLSQYYNIKTNVRNIIAPLEIDIFIEEKQLAFEYNGLYWHSSEFKDKDYHLNKTKKCAEKNIQLIHIFEDEWVNKQEIVKSRLLGLLGETPNKIFARKCVIKEIDSKIANQFLKENHLQGSGRSNVSLGLYYNNQLVSVMTFLKGDISKRISGWELNRFCSKLYTNIPGGATRLFKYFLNNYNPDTITSFADSRWSKKDAVYSRLGFEFEHNTVPNYWYFSSKDTTRHHRYKFKTTKDLTEKQQVEKYKLMSIYDCGSSKWVWRRKKAE